MIGMIRKTAREIKLYDYQERIVKEAAVAVAKHKKVVIAMPTGSGKSIVIAYIANKIKGRTLILTHRAEILKQNSEWLVNTGVLTRDENSVQLNSMVAIAMVQTLHARIKKNGLDYIGSFDTIIVDECHIDIFQKVYKLYEFKYLIGFTATPTTMKRELVTIDDIEYWKDITLKDQYNVLVGNIQVSELIEKGYLVREKSYQLILPNMNELEDSNRSPDGYSTSSLTNVYSNKASLKVLWEAYETLCKGKKVLLFNATTEVNVTVTKMFRKMGIDVRNFDSVNNKESERQDVLEWFENARDAVLIGTNVFTTGFNVPDIEVVIVNRATKSLSLWIQMVGRGSRTTDKIDKNEFIVIDLGQNIDRHGEWSEDIDWQTHFNFALEPKKKKETEQIWECPVCGHYNKIQSLACENPTCAELKPALAQMVAEKKAKDGEIVEVKRQERRVPLAGPAIKYTMSKDSKRSTAFKVFDNHMLTMVKEYKFGQSAWIQNRAVWEDYIEKCYLPALKCINRNQRLDGRRSKLDTRMKKLMKKIDNYYDV